MKYPSLLISSFSLLLALSGSVLHAEEHEAHEQHGAHEHGVATLALAVGLEGMEITLESPAANVLGFEHMPTTDADKERLNDVVKKLEAGDALFTPNAEAECVLQDTEVLSALLGDEEPADKDHAQEKHAEDEHGGEAHNDVDVAWSYTCAKPGELKEVEVKLFSAFPEGFQHIKAEWVTEKGASAQALTQDASIQLN